MKKIGLLLIMLLVATSCAQQVTDNTTNTQDNDKVEKPIPTATFELSPDQVEVAVGDTFDLQAILTVENGKAEAVDMLVHYDPAILEVVDMVEDKDGIQVGTGGLFGNGYFVNRVEDGVIFVSAGAIDKADFFEGSDTYATFTFKALAASDQSPVFFDYDPSKGDNTLDTDVILHETTSDIISGTQGTNVVVK